MHLNHQAILTSLIAALTISLLSSCSGSSTNKPTAETIQTEDSTSNDSENTTPQATSNSDIDPKNAQHYYSEMQTTTKRATLNYGPKAIEHLKIANKTLNDPDVAKIIGQLENNVAAYKK